MSAAGAVAVSKAARAVQDRTVRLMKEVKELYEGFRLIVFGAASLVRGIPALIKVGLRIFECIACCYETSVYTYIHVCVCIYMQLTSNVHRDQLSISVSSKVPVSLS